MFEQWHDAHCAACSLTIVQGLPADTWLVAVSCARHPTIRMAEATCIGLPLALLLGGWCIGRVSWHIAVNHAPCHAWAALNTLKESVGKTASLAVPLQRRLLHSYSVAVTPIDVREQIVRARFAIESAVTISQ